MHNNTCLLQDQVQGVHIWMQELTMYCIIVLKYGVELERQQCTIKKRAKDNESGIVTIVTYRWYENKMKDFLYLVTY